MPVTKKLLAQDQDENQLLKVDSSTRYILNEESEWQMLFNGNSGPTTSTHILKIGCEFNAETFNSIRVTSYLYNTDTGGIDNAGTGIFNIYVVRSPAWQDVFVDTFVGTLESNAHFFKEIASTSLPGVDLFGGDTLLIESVVTRLNETYRDRIYVNHLGIFANVTQVRQEVDYLDITKQDV